MHLFIYGTLMSTGHANRILSGYGAEMVGPARMPGVIMYDVNGAFPCVVPSPYALETDEVWGEVWRLPINRFAATSAMYALNAYEGVPILYNLSEGFSVDVFDVEGTTYRDHVRVYTFAQSTEGLQVVENGIWDEENNQHLVDVRNGYYELAQPDEDAQDPARR